MWFVDLFLAFSVAVVAVSVVFGLWMAWGMVQSDWFGDDD